MKRGVILFALMMIALLIIPLAFSPLEVPDPPSMGETDDSSGSNSNQNEGVNDEEPGAIDEAADSSFAENNMDNLDIYETNPGDEETVPMPEDAGGNSAGENTASPDMDAINAQIAKISRSIDYTNSRLTAIEKFLDNQKDAKTEMPASNMAGLYFLLVICTILLSAIVIFGIFLYKDKLKTLFTIIPTMSAAGKKVSSDASGIDLNKVDILRGYACYNLEKGYTKEVLRKELLEEGYNEREVDMALKR